MQFCSSLSILWHCLSLGLEWTLIFSSPVVAAEFSTFTFTASSFRIWNSSTGIPSPPLALFVVMLSKAHLTSHSRMSGSRWVNTLLWLSGSWRSFLYSSSVYYCHLFLDEINIWNFYVKWYHKQNLKANKTLEEIPTTHMTDKSSYLKSSIAC